MTGASICREILVKARHFTDASGLTHYSGVYIRFKRIAILRVARSGVLVETA
jgi:hypothetical protein